MTDAVFRETTADPRTQSIPLSHISLEIGHLYMEDFEAGPERLREHFARVRPWVDAVLASAVNGKGRGPGSAPASSSTTTSAGSPRPPRSSPSC